MHQLLGLESEKALLEHPKVGASWEGFVIEQVLAAELHDDDPVDRQILDGGADGALASLPGAVGDEVADAGETPQDGLLARADA